MDASRELSDVTISAEDDYSTSLQDAMEWLLRDPSLTASQRTALAQLPDRGLTLARIDRILRATATP